MTKAAGTLALVGGDEWTEPCRAFDQRLLELAGTTDVVVLATAAAFERPELAIEQATNYFDGLGARVTALDVLNRRDAEADANVSAIRVARFVYVADGSPLHLRSVLKGSEFYEALVYAYRAAPWWRRAARARRCSATRWSIPAAARTRSGSASCRGSRSFRITGARPSTCGSGRSTCSRDALLVGIDEQTALVRTGEGAWDVLGAGGVTLYRKGAKPKRAKSGTQLDLELATTR